VKVKTRRLHCYEHGLVTMLWPRKGAGLGLGPICVRCFRVLIPDTAERRQIVQDSFLNTPISAGVPGSGARVTAGRQSPLTLVRGGLE
jgi:hypothetical protein